jgi:DNA-binding MurR/RpiR family transcriptional regulator
MATKDLLATIERSYEEMTPQLRKAARFVMQNPTEVALLPLRRFAERAGVSPTTLIRLAAALGYAGYEDFREPFRDSLRPGSERYSGAATQLVERRGHHGFDAVFANTGAVLSAQIAELFRTTSANDLAAAGKNLASAKTIYVLGLRSCYAAAFYFNYAAGTFRDNVRLVDVRQGMLFDELFDLGPKDAILAISFSPYPLDTVRSVNYAEESGAKLVAITDNRLSPIAQRAQHVFVVPNVNSSFYTSLVPTLALLEALISFLLMDGGKKNVEKIKRRFARLEQQGVYWNDRSTPKRS